MEVRSLQNQLLQVERKLDQKSKELERNQESNSKLQNSLAQQQLTISQVKQGQTDTKSTLGAEIKRLEHLHNTCRQELTSCRNQVCTVLSITISSSVCQRYDNIGHLINNNFITSRMFHALPGVISSC